MALLSLLVAAYALTYILGPGGIMLPPELRASFDQRRPALTAHVLASATALLLGPLQFSTRLRTRRPALHRLVGRRYLVAAIPIGGLAGLYLSAFALGAPITTLGFGGLALAWLFTGLQGFQTARARDFDAHRRWMIRNFALTFAAVTLRLHLALTYLLGLPFLPNYQLISWLCWLPNLAVAELLARGPRPVVSSNRLESMTPRAAWGKHDTSA
jgi:uncharacterized membrane protein